jgi:hypothetical protein
MICSEVWRKTPAILSVFVRVNFCVNFGMVVNWWERDRSAAKVHILFLLIGLNLIQELTNAIATRQICLVKAARI